MLVELAVAAEAFAIITFNKRDFAGTEKIFGIRILDPKEFLQLTGERL